MSFLIERRGIFAGMSVGLLVSAIYGYTQGGCFKSVMLTCLLALIPALIFMYLEKKANKGA